MGILSSITKLDRNVGWSFLGFMLAALFGALSLYTEFWKELTPSLEFEVLSNAPVLDVREKLPDLEVLYRSQEISKSGKTLSVLLVRAINRGSADLLSTYYDSKAPIGMDLSGGTLIRADLSEASNEYLREAVGIISKDSVVSFEPVILERDEWFTVKMLVLHDLTSQPEISAHGKVAGQHSIPVAPSIPATEKESFLTKSFSGSAWVQLARIPAYLFAFMLIVLGVVIPFSSILEAITERKRKKIIKRFKEKTKIEIADSDEFIFNGFINHGLRYVHLLTNTVADPERLEKHVTRYLEEDERRRQDQDVLISDDMIREMSINGRRVYMPGRFVDVRAMIKHGFIVETEGTWKAVPERLKVATSFIEYVELIDASNV